MPENIVEIFENYNLFMRKLNKNLYEKNMNSFRANHGEKFNFFLKQINEDSDKKEKAQEISKEFANTIYYAFSKRDRMTSSKRADLSFYMIYYIFPAILLTEDENATLLCDEMRDAWNEKFGEKINYTDFATLLGGFRDKLFGIF